MIDVIAGPARIVQYPALVDADPRLVGFEILRGQEAHIIGSDHRGIERQRQIDRPGDIRLFARPAGALQFQIKAVAERAQPVFGPVSRLVRMARQNRSPDLPLPAARERKQALVMGFQPVRHELRNALVLVFAVGAGNELGQGPVAGLVLDEQRHGKRGGGFHLVEKQHIGPGDRLDATGLRRLVELDQREEVGMVSDGHCRHAQLYALFDQRLDVHQPVDQGILRVQAQVDETGRDHYGSRIVGLGQGCFGETQRQRGFPGGQDQPECLGQFVIGQHGIPGPPCRCRISRGRDGIKQGGAIIELSLANSVFPDMAGKAEPGGLAAAGEVIGAGFRARVKAAPMHVAVGDQRRGFGDQATPGRRAVLIINDAEAIPFAHEP